MFLTILRIIYIYIYIYGKLLYTSNLLSLLLVLVCLRPNINTITSYFHSLRECYVKTNNSQCILVPCNRFSWNHLCHNVGSFAMFTLRTFRCLVSTGMNIQFHMITFCCVSFDMVHYCDLMWYFIRCNF